MNLNKELSIWWTLFWTCCDRETEEEFNYSNKTQETINYFDNYIERLVDDLKIFEPKAVAKYMHRFLDENEAKKIYNSFFDKTDEVYSRKYWKKLAEPLKEYLDKTIIVDKNTELALDFLETKNQIKLWEKELSHSCLYLLVPKESIKEKMLFNDYQPPHILKVEWERLIIETWTRQNFWIHFLWEYIATSYSFDEEWKLIEIYKSSNLKQGYYETNDLYY